MVGSLTIAKPGSDGTTTLEWDGDAPFFASCRHPITLLHAPGVRNEVESEQADNRISYLHLKVKVPDQVRARKLRPCGRCGAKLYLEGRATLDARRPADEAPAAPLADAAGSAAPPAQARAEAADDRAPKRRKSVGIQWEARFRVESD